MTQDGFRKLALTLPEAEESSHLDHPDFRVRKRVFATLSYPDSSWGMVKLTPDQQARHVGRYPRVFVPVKGGWGARGATQVRLRTATRLALWPALRDAWQNRASKRLAAEHAELEM